MRRLKCAPTSLPDGEIDMPVVALVSSSRKLRRILRTAFDGHGFLEFWDASSLDRRSAEDLRVLQQADVVLVDLEPDHQQAIADIRVLREQGVWGEFVPISKNLSGAAMRALFELRTADWIPVSGGRLPSGREIASACEKAVQKAQFVPQSSPESRCSCFFAAAGGVGQTTLVAAAGLLMMERRPGRRSVCLIDLNFQNSILADYMGVEPSLDLEAISRAPERIDQTLLQIMLSRHASGLSILAAPRERWRTLHDLRASVPRMLNVASEMFDDVVIDLPTTCTAWTADVLAGSDDIYIVTDFSVTGVRQAKELVDTMPQAAGTAQKPRVIVNKTQTWTFGGGLRRQDVSDVLEGSLAGFIPDRGRQVQDIVNLGRPDELLSSGLGIAKDLKKVLAELEMA